MKVLAKWMAIESDDIHQGFLLFSLHYCFVD